MHELAAVRALVVYSEWQSGKLNTELSLSALITLAQVSRNLYIAIGKLQSFVKLWWAQRVCLPLLWKRYTREAISSYRKQDPSVASHRFHPRLSMIRQFLSSSFKDTEPSATQLCIPTTESHAIALEHLFVEHMPDWMRSLVLVERSDRCPLGLIVRLKPLNFTLPNSVFIQEHCSKAA